MKNVAIALVGLPALLASTAVLAADLPKSAVVASGPGYALSVSGGVIGFSMPTLDSSVEATGEYTVTDPGSALGMQGSLSGSFDLGTSGGAKLSLGVDVFGAMANGSQNSTITFTGPGTVVIPGYTTPSGTIELTTGTGTGESDIGSTTENQTVTEGTSVSGEQDALGVKEGDGIFTYAATNGSVSAENAAYGAIASTEGGIFIGCGDLTGLSVTTKTSQQVIYGGADINLAATGDLGNGVSLQAYIGPSYKYLGQTNTTITSVTVPTATPTDLVYPTYSDTRIEDLTSNYFGGLGGLNFTAPVSKTMALTLGGSAGVYDMWTNWNGSESYSISGGANAPGGSSALPITTETVTNANKPSGSGNGFAYSAGVNGALTMAMTDTLSVTLGAGAEYLSAVPVLSHATPVLTSGSTSYTGPQSGATPTLGFASMWNWSGSVALTGHF